MKLALLSDIHGNLPALEAVLDDISRQGITTIWFLGDWIGHGPFPNQVVEKLRAVKVRGICGNYDRKVLEFDQNKRKLREKMEAGKYASLKWTAQELGHTARVYLTALPAEFRLEVEGVRFLLVHGSPVDDSEVLTAATPLTRLQALARQAGNPDVMLCGHSHQAFARRAGKVRFVNPGSAGRPFDGDNRVSYAVLEVARSQVKVTFRRLAYDVKRVAKAMQAAGLPEDQIQSFACGRSTDDLKKIGPEAEVTAAAVPVGKVYNYEAGHAAQVTKLALQLFAGLRELHGLGADEWPLLETAGRLHDIGLQQGPDRHHKRSRDLILALDLPLKEKQKKMVALIARYHRGALPDNRHRYYADLNKKDRAIVDQLSALLRLADGLDRSHRDVVREIICSADRERVRLRLKVRAPALQELRYGLKKADLLEKVWGRTVELTARE
jgi:putative phosphoesterase